jgi:hypothetical protein
MAKASPFARESIFTGFARTEDLPDLFCGAELFIFPSLYEGFGLPVLEDMSFRDKIVERMIATQERFNQSDAKRVYYLSMEFLMGRSLGNTLYNLGLFDS